MLKIIQTIVKILTLMATSTKEVKRNMIAKMYAIEIANGELTFDKVPKFLRKRVKRELERMDLGELAVETVEKN